MNNRGSRPVGNAHSFLFEVKRGQWYGWPDFIGGEAIELPRFRSLRDQAPPLKFLIANHAELGEPAVPEFQFPSHTGPTHFVVEPESGNLLITLFGDKRPLTGMPGPRAGRKVVRLDLQTGILSDYSTEEFQRPIHLAYAPDGGGLYVVDFGEYEIESGGRFIARPWHWASSSNGISADCQREIFCIRNYMMTTTPSSAPEKPSNWWDVSWGRSAFRGGYGQLDYQ